MPSDLIRGWKPRFASRNRVKSRAPFRFNRNGKGSSRPLNRQQLSLSSYDVCHLWRGHGFDRVASLQTQKESDLSKVALLLAGTVVLSAVAPSANAESVGATNRAVVGPPFKPTAETRKIIGPPFKPTAETRKLIGPPFKPTASPVGQKQSGSERSIIIVSGKNSQSGSIGSPVSRVMLNPQPLPPKAR